MRKLMFALLILLGFGVPVLAQDDAQPIDYGDTVEATQSSNDGDYWVFVGFEDDIVAIDMLSDDFDTYVELFDPTGSLVAYNDDHGGTLDSEIADFELPEDGTYTIIARSFAGGSNGTYTITLEGEAAERTRGDDDDDGAQVAGEEQGDIELGTVVEGNITTDAGDVWTFTGEEDDIILIAMNNPSTDCYLDLYAPDGENLLRDDDGGIGYNAAIVYQLPEDGVYTIVTSGFAGQTGAYSMSVVVLEDFDALVVARVDSSNNVNLRDGVDGDVVDSTYPGDYFLLIGRSEDAEWVEIASVEDVPLWISASLITLEDIGTGDDIEDLPVTE